MSLLMDQSRPVLPLWWAKVREFGELLRFEKKSLSKLYPFELYLNLFLMCAWLCFYFLSLFYVLIVARAFSYFLFARACIIVMLYLADVETHTLY